MDNITRTVELLKKPDGSQQFPSRSCCDLKEQYPEKVTGMQPHCFQTIPLYSTVLDLSPGTYWIDPNGGYPSDAFEVECNFDDGACSTCIPMQRQVCNSE